MNFFNQEENTQDMDDNSYNFLNNQELFNFNQDTFAPEKFNTHEDNFAQNNLK